MDNTSVVTVHLIDIGNDKYITSVVVDQGTFDDVWYELGKLVLNDEMGAPYNRRELEKLKEEGFFPKLLRNKATEHIFVKLEKLAGESIITSELAGGIRDGECNK